MAKLSLFNRYTEIGNVLVKYGFGQFLQEVGLLKLLNQRKDKRAASTEMTARRLRRVLEDLGPTFIKLGQLLSTRTDMLPPEYIKELIRLQEHVPAAKASEITEIITQELGRPLNLLFSRFEPEPVASASIGQVHRAELADGTPVAVKVRRPGIESLIEGDLHILARIAAVLDRHKNWGELYDFRGLVKEFNRMLSGELNLFLEGKNTELFLHHYRNDDNILIPRVFWSYTTEKVLTMEYLQGTALGENGTLPEDCHIDAGKAAQNLTNAFLEQVFKWGYFHGDPHPGNVFFLPPAKIVLLDFGTIGHLTENNRSHFTSILLGLMEKDADRVMDDLFSIGVAAKNIDRTLLRQDIERLRDRYFDVALKDISVGEGVEELLAVSFKHRIRLPTQFTLLGRALVNLEGTVSRLDDSFSIAEGAAPFAKELLKESLSIKSLNTKLLRAGRKYLRLLLRIPDDLGAVLNNLTDGDMQLKIDITQADYLMQKLTGMVNRLSFSIVLAALIVGLSFILRDQGNSLFGGLPVLEIVLGIAGLMGFWLLWSIIRSGRF